MPDLVIRTDDLTGEATRALVAFHLAGMHAASPPESVFALDVDGLRSPNVTFWSAWRGETLVGIAALARLDDANGEVKSMRVTDAARGTGAGRALVRHLVGEARARGLRTLWLETGTPEEFLPARRLYASEGFTECGAFGDYSENPFSVFMTRSLVE